jgi:putative mycofactocin binding protein MftB
MIFRMERQGDKRYTLALGTQVREEEFGLLFYTMAGPRLYFLYSGHALDGRFFQGEFTLEQWMEKRGDRRPVQRQHMLGLRRSLNQLKEKGVLIEC